MIDKIKRLIKMIDFNLKQQSTFCQRHLISITL